MALSDRTPVVGELWVQKPTAAMRAERVTRTVVVTSIVTPGFRGACDVHVQPAPGETGRRAVLDLVSFLRKFDPKKD